MPSSTTLFGSDLGFDLNGRVLMLVLVAALISAGSDTLMRSHPRLANQPSQSTVIHWILPGASALVLGAVLNRTAGWTAVVAGPGAQRLGADHGTDRRVRQSSIASDPAWDLAALASDRAGICAWRWCCLPCSAASVRAQ